MVKVETEVKEVKKRPSRGKRKSMKKDSPSELEWEE